MKKTAILTISALLIGVMGACSTMRAMYGIQEPLESEASIRRKITSAVDSASAEIINSLPKGIKIAVIGGSSSVSDQETVVSLFKSQGYSDSEARSLVQQLERQDVSALAALQKQQEASPENSYADYAVEDLEYNMVKAGFRLVDRQQIEKIRNEQEFQMSGDVDDNSAVSIGKIAGADAVIIIGVNYFDKSGRLTLKALDVETAEIVAMARQEF